MRFAREQFHILALTLLPSTASVEGEAVQIEMWRFVLEHVAAVYGQAKAPEVAVALWAFLRGMAALEAAGVFAEAERKPLSSFEFGLEMWLKGASGDEGEGEAFGS